MLMHWNVSDFAALAGGLVFGHDASMPVRIVSDSRDVLPGDAFIALSGAQQNGHLFLGDAVKRGATILIGSNEILLRKFENNITCVVFKNAEMATIDAAKKYINIVNPIVISVTGSVGKTTTRECIYNILLKKYKVHRPFRSYNTTIGCALTILSMPVSTNILILEMGANHENEIGSMVSMFPPDVAVITEVSASHLEGFKTIENILSSKCEIYKNIKTKVLFYNSDRFELHKKILNNSKDKLVYGVGKENSYYRIIKPEFKMLNGQPNLSFILLTKKEEYNINAKFIGVHNIYSIAFALSIGEHFNVKKNKMLESVSQMQQLDGRGVYIPLKFGVTLIDDAYNANPLSMKAALDALKNIDFKGKKIVVLGEMKELGSDSIIYHKEILKQSSFCDFIILYGDIWKNLLLDINSDSMSSNIKICQTLEECFCVTDEHIKDNVVVLVKGSHSNNLDIIVSKIKKAYSI